MRYEQFCEQLGCQPVACERLGERLYLTNDALASWKSGEQRKPYAKGLFLGRETSRGFSPSAALLRLLAEQPTAKKASISDEHVEHLFLCGRDALAGNVTTNHRSGLVLVQNKHDENLGLGEVMTDRAGKPFVKNHLDRGNYLRHERVVRL